MTDVNQTYHGDHFAIYLNIKLFCTLKTNICQLYFNKKEKYRSLQVRDIQNKVRTVEYIIVNDYCSVKGGETENKLEIHKILSMHLKNKNGN